MIIFSTVLATLIRWQLMFLSSMRVSTLGVESTTIPSTSPPKSATISAFKLIHLIEEIGIGNGKILILLLQVLNLHYNILLAVTLGILDSTGQDRPIQIDTLI